MRITEAKPIVKAGLFTGVVVAARMIEFLFETVVINAIPEGWPEIVAWSLMLTGMWVGVLVLAYFLFRRMSNQPSSEAPRTYSDDEKLHKAGDLTALVELDRKRLPVLVRALGINSDPNTLRYTSPYINFDFEIANMSIFTIKQQSIRGHLFWDEHELGGAIEFLTDPHEIERGEISHVAFRQWIGDMAHPIDMQPRVPIFFKDIEIVFSASLAGIVEDADPAEFRLVLPDSFARP